MKNKKKLITAFLKKQGRSSTAKIAAAIKSNQWMAQKYLEALEKEGQVRHEKETLGTYWKPAGFQRRSR